MNVLNKRMIILIFLVFLLNKFSYALELNVLGYTLYEDSQVFSPMVNDFNNYSSKNNLNITINLNMLTNQNSTFDLSDYGSMVETLLKKKSKKYDFIIYDIIYTPKFAPYFLNLYNNIEKEHLDVYDKNILTQSSVYNNRLVGLPITLNYMALYSNEILLNKYNQTIPKTWDELLETSKYILSEEKKNNNTDIFGYNGLFKQDINGVFSLIEFIYTYRESIDSPFPGVTSQEAIEAMEMIKKLKNEIDTENIFQDGGETILKRAFAQKMLFFKFWIFADPMYSLIRFYQYKISSIPSGKNGVLGTSLYGYNMSIIKNIDESKKKEAIEVYKYLTSKDIQRKFLKTRMLISAILSLYDEEDVCKEVECDFYKNAYGIVPPNFTPTIYERDEYYDHVQKYAYEYFFEDKDLNEVIKKIDKIKEFHYLSMDSEDYYLGLIFYIIFVSLITIILFSLVFIFLENFNPFFKFLTEDLWLLTITGIILFLFVGITKIGIMTSIKCNLITILLSFAFTFNYIPILYKLIVNFPDENKISELVKKYKYSFIFIFILIDIVFNGLILINEFSIEYIYISYENKYQICKMNDIFGIIIIITLVVYKFLVIIILLLLLFMEWNIQSTMTNVRLVMTAIYVDTLLLIILITLDILNIKNFIVNSVIRECIFILIPLANYVLIYGYNVIYGFLHKKNMKKDFIQGINKNFVNDEDISYNSKVTKVYESNIKATREYESSDNEESNTDRTRRFSVANESISYHKNSFMSKIINYHYTVEASGENFNDTESKSIYKTTTY